MAIFIKNKRVKNILLFFFVVLAFTTKAQQADNCVLVLNSKELNFTDVITADDISQFCKVVFRDAATKKDLLPVSFQWVVSNNGKIIKGDWTGCQQLIDAAKGMASGDVLYINEIKYKGVKGQCKEQFALRLQ